MKAMEVQKALQNSQFCHLCTSTLLHICLCRLQAGWRLLILGFALQLIVMQRKQSCLGFSWDSCRAFFWVNIPHCQAWQCLQILVRKSGLNAIFWHLIASCSKGCFTFESMAKSSSWSILQHVFGPMQGSLQCADLPHFCTCSSLEGSNESVRLTAAMAWTRADGLYCKALQLFNIFAASRSISRPAICLKH